MEVLKNKKFVIIIILLFVVLFCFFVFHKKPIQSSKPLNNLVVVLPTRNETSPKTNPSYVDVKSTGTSVVPPPQLEKNQIKENSSFKSKIVSILANIFSKEQKNKCLSKDCEDKSINSEKQNLTNKTPSFPTDLSVSNLPENNQKIKENLTVKEPPVVAPSDTCFEVSYKHDKYIGHNNLDDCSNHKNLISFKSNKIHPDLSNKSVCIKVDGNPVRFKKSDNKYLLGPGPGPDSIITFRYCPLSLRSSNECDLPKDSFISAIGGQDEEDNKHPSARWDESNHDHKIIDVDSELGPELNPHNMDEQGLTLFDGWTEVSTKVEKVSKGN